MATRSQPAVVKPWFDRLAHDLRSPLTSLQTAAYLLRADPGGSNARELADIVVRQSQRLAKSVSQALIGDIKAFPGVRESVEVLARNTRSLSNGEGDVPMAPENARQAIAPLLPLIDRAEKNANTVISQQKTLTQVTLTFLADCPDTSVPFQRTTAIRRTRSWS